MGEFTPPRCPNRRCRMHGNPLPRFYIRRGSYLASCRPVPVPRFQCRSCERNFSRQTFRLDYRDHRPECNVQLFQLLISGCGLRQCGRIVQLSVRSVQRKFRKVARAMRQLNRNLLRSLPDTAHRTFLLDEIETFEHSSIMRLTVPVLIERESLAVLAVDVGPIRRVPRRGSHRQRWLARHELKHGSRGDRSRACVRRVLGRLRRLWGQRPGLLQTDEKALYGALLRRQWPESPATMAHETTPSRLPRTVCNPLFPINLTDAMLRDNNGRLRRRTWLVSKLGKYLRSQLELFVAYRNWHRPRTNFDVAERTPGVVLGLAERPFEFGEMLAWRQNWRERSIHPTSADGQRAIGSGWRQRAA